MTPHACVHCGREFMPHRAAGRFCSRGCYQADRTGRRHGPYKPPLEKVCAACGKTFTVPRTGGYRKQFLCSPECQRAARYRHGATARTLSPTEAAWLAGFLDGEGSIMLHGRATAVALRVTATNTHRPTLDHITRICGVGATVWRKKHYGDPSRHKQSGWWLANGEAAASVLRQTAPYMVTKAEQVALALRFQEQLKTPALKADRSWQLADLEQMRRLNRRGPA